MIGAVVILAATAYVFYKVGQANESVKHAPGPVELADDLRRAAASREWRA